MRSDDPAAFIQDNLPIIPVPGLPDIRLHQAAPASGLHRLAARDEEGFGSPYWAYRWAGGLALARYLADRPEASAGRVVLDLGAGSGLVGIAAAMAGAARVIAAELDRYAVVALGLNAALNGVAIEAWQRDPLDDPPPPVDIVLAGDLFYAPDLALRVTAFLDRCLAAGIEVLVGDPWRAPLPTLRLRELARYQVSETRAEIPAGVFAFVKADDR